MARIDLTGQRFGRLVAIKDAGYVDHGHRVWECKCDCGNTVFVRAGSLKSGYTKYCGCLQASISRENLEKAHKWSRTHDLKEHTKLSALNDKISSANKSGVKGVYWKGPRQLWIARLYFKGVLVLDSGFAKKEDAIKARRDAEEKYFKPILEKYHRDKE